MVTRAIPPSQIRLIDNSDHASRVECPQCLLVRLLHYLSSHGFKCGIARISSQENKQRVQKIVSFDIDGSTIEEIKYAVRIFLSTAHVKFIEKSDKIETVFRLESKSLSR